MFTSSQIEEIRKKLQLGGVKDTQFPIAESLKGNETMAIVQQGQNKQLRLKTFIEKVGAYTISDFLNISKNSEDSYTLKEVLSLVDSVNRKAGQVITFMDSDSGDWAIYQFKGKSSKDWFNTELWDNILAKVDSHFKGWFVNECLLTTYYPRPMVGDYAFVGESLEDAVVYVCLKYGEWYNTNNSAMSFADKYKAVYSKDFGEFDVEMDETYADRATKDALGRVIHDTYVTLVGLSNFVGEEILKQIVNIQIQDGSITWDKLSESVKQLLTSGGEVTNLPDDEDLTVNSDNQLKFADKTYNENDFTGYGRVFLRKNMIDGSNVLEQYQISEANTRYIIQYVHCLNDSTIEVPENCILDFSAGGCFQNGTLVCNNTLIIALRSEDIDVTLEGTYQFFGMSTSTEESIKEIITETIGGAIIVDDALSTTSENPVQNKVITEAINKINAELFPLSVTVSGGGTYELGTTQNITISWTVKEGSDTITPDSIKVNGTEVSSTATSYTFIGVTSTTTYTVTVTYNGSEVSGSTTATFVAPMYFGFDEADNVSDLNITSLNKQTIKTSPSGTYTLTNPITGYYMWLCIPSSMTINSVTSSGFEVPMESYETGSTSITTYKCYRSSSAFNAGSTTIVIS